MHLSNKNKEIKKCIWLWYFYLNYHFLSLSIVYCKEAEIILILKYKNFNINLLQLDFGKVHERPQFYLIIFRNLTKSYYNSNN